MTLNEFLQHHRLIENPFRGEEARTDAVFARMGHNQPAERVATPTSRSFELHHSDFEKIVGDLRRPSASVVFGEKEAARRRSACRSHAASTSTTPSTPTRRCS